MSYNQMRKTSDNIIALVEDGTISAEFALRAALQWMSEVEVEQMVTSQSDWEGLGLYDEEED